MDRDAVRTGRLRWVIVDATQGAGLPGDTRTGSQAALDVVAKHVPPGHVKSQRGKRTTMYDCLGRAVAILQAAKE